MSFVPDNERRSFHKLEIENAGGVVGLLESDQTVVVGLELLENTKQRSSPDNFNVFQSVSGDFGVYFGGPAGNYFFDASAASKSDDPRKIHSAFERRAC